MPANDSPRLGPDTAIAGVPDGVVVVRIGAATDKDYELINNGITKGRRAGAASGVIVAPAPGYAFVSEGIRNPWNYVVVRSMPERIVTARFRVTNSLEAARVDALSEMPEFMSAQEDQ